MPIHSLVEENTSEPELQVEESNVESPLVEGLEIINEIQKARGTDNSSETITKEGLNNKTDIESSDTEVDDKPHVTHRYPTRSSGPIEYVSLDMLVIIKMKEDEKDQKISIYGCGWEEVINELNF
ncbi:hypothetical protein JTB14_034459 [Gonioctena quinquepunctata]|nr:hypothetical protein JTB14_034459 [Gonioctena quinquepunctata]